MTLHRRSLFSLAAAAALGPRVLRAGTFRPPEPTAVPGAFAGWKIQRLTWAGIRIEGAGSTLFIDPFVSTGIWDGAWARPVVPPEASSSRRAVLLSHLHNDHFDPAAVKQALGDSGVVICLDRMAPVVASRGFRVWAVAAYMPEKWGDFVVVPVPAADGFGVEQVSWVVIAGDRRLIHGGDTNWHSRFDLFGRAYGRFDLAFLPVNGAVVRGDDPPFDDEPRTLTPRRAVTASTLLRARTLVPIHYGHSDASYQEHANALAELRTSARDAGQEVRIVEEGDWVWTGDR